MAPRTWSIAEVERETGLAKDTLRVWERRYGFPVPSRDAAGERAYPLAQVQQAHQALEARQTVGATVLLP